MFEDTNGLAVGVQEVLSGLEALKVEEAVIRAQLTDLEAWRRQHLKDLAAIFGVERVVEAFGPLVES